MKAVCRETSRLLPLLQLFADVVRKQSTCSDSDSKQKGDAPTGASPFFSMFYL